MKISAQKTFIWAPLRGIFVLALLASSPLGAQSAFAEDDAAPTEEATPADTAKEGAEAKPEGGEVAPEAAAESADAAKPAAAAAIKPWQLNVEPIFKGPAVKKFMTPSDLTGRD
ncbi:MAG: hypothetical protein RL189_2629, partial [Pseudomonadota bacterium]